MDRLLSQAEIDETVRILRERNVGGSVCLECGVEYFWLKDDGWHEGGPIKSCEEHGDIS
jgi:uncharacterized OB-fold protein